MTISSLKNTLSYALMKNLNPLKKKIVFIHGLYGNKNNWKPIARDQELQKLRDPILVDLRNHGASDHHDSMKYDEMSYDLFCLFNEELKLSGESLTLVGHSMGGKLAMTFATLYPNLVDGLFIIDSRPCDYNNLGIGESVRQTLNILLNLDLNEPLGRKRIIQTLAEKTNPTFANFMNTNLVTYNRSIEWRINLKGIEKNISSILGYEVLGEYKGRIRILNGEKSQRFASQDFIRIFPNIRQDDIKVIEGAAHWVQADKPEETKFEILEFVKSIDMNI